MSNAKHETITDIVAEMRTRWAEAYHSEHHKTLAGNDPENEFVSIDTEELADRIKAAHLRECEALREERNRAGLIEREKLAPRLRELEAWNARLRAALKPVLECKVMSAMTAEIEPGKSEYCATIIEKAQRIYNEGGENEVNE